MAEMTRSKWRTRFAARGDPNLACVDLSAWFSARSTCGGQFTSAKPHRGQPAGVNSRSTADGIPGTLCAGQFQQGESAGAISPAVLAGAKFEGADLSGAISKRQPHRRGKRP